MTQRPAMPHIQYYTTKLNRMQMFFLLNYKFFIDFFDSIAKLQFLYYNR